METAKSPKNMEVTPSKKKLKQGRLPFMLISEVSPKPVESKTRKRKLSVPDAEPITKIGKISKENDLVNDIVVLSDDSQDTTINKDKPVNPFVKIVDTAWKKKLQKSKSTKKKNRSKSSKKKNSESQQIPHDDNVSDADIEMVDVSVEIHEESDKDDQKHDSENKAKITNNNEVISKSDDKLSKDTNEKLLQSDTSFDAVEKTVEHTSTCTIDTKPQTEKTENLPESPKKNEEKVVNIETAELSVTPKRSVRNKTKVEEKTNLNTSTNSSKLDDTMSSEPSTPKQKLNSTLSSNGHGEKSLNDSTTSANLTPKQLQKKLELTKKREEREKEKLEREKKKQQEKDEKAKQRQEKDEQRKREREEKEEAKKKEKEEKEEQRKKEREEKEKQKELEKKQKEMKEEQKRKEREDKEEQKKKEKEAKEEERRKKQEALDQEKQEQELKKKKASEAFVNFFVPKQKVDKDPSSASGSTNSILSKFTIKSDMRLAPLVRSEFDDDRRKVIDKDLTEQKVPLSCLYLKALKDKTIQPLSSGKTWPLSDKDDDDDVMIVEDELPPIGNTGEIVTCEPTVREKLRPKLLSFHENRRPPYWGTWRKKSNFIKPRKPLGQDEKQLDYEVDSDDDWEEEQEGESLDGSVCGSDEEGDARGDDYEVDNEVFVPHGYLSDEEATMEEDDVLTLTPEAQKARLKHLEDEFESELKKPTEKLKPRLYGLYWETDEGKKPDYCNDTIWSYFEKFAMILDDPTPFLKPTNEAPEVETKKAKKKKITTKENGEVESPKPEKKKRAKSENKESKKTITEGKKSVPNQPGINAFLTKLKAT